MSQGPNPASCGFRYLLSQMEFETGSRYPGNCTRVPGS